MKYNANKTVNIPGNWLYVCDQQINAGQLKVIAQHLSYEVEYWEELQILEITYGEKNSVDFELANLSRADEFTLDYLKEQKARSVFLVSFKEENFEQVKVLFSQFIELNGGYFCGDTQDFTPVFMGTDMK